MKHLLQSIAFMAMGVVHTSPCVGNYIIRDRQKIHLAPIQYHKDARETRSNLRHALLGLRTHIRNTYTSLPECDDKISTPVANFISENSPETVEQHLPILVGYECQTIYDEQTQHLPGNHPMRHIHLPEIRYVYEHIDRLIPQYQELSPERRLSGHARYTRLSDSSEYNTPVREQRNSWHRIKQTATHLHDTLMDKTYTPYVNKRKTE